MTDTLTPEQIAELEALLAKATPGPWRVETMRPNTLGIETVWSNDMQDIADCSKAARLPYSTRVEPEEIESNAAAIAALRNAAPALIDMAKRSIELEAIKNSLLKDWSQNSLYGRFQMLGRAEKAEADVARYREMAVRLAKALNGICKGRLGTTFDRLFAQETITSADVKSLLEETSHG